MENFHLLYSTIATIDDPKFVPHFLPPKKESSSYYGHSERDQSQDALEQVIYQKVVLYVMRGLLETSDENFDVFQSLLQSARSLKVNEKRKQEGKKKTDQETSHDPAA